jgi:hypothetical protein
MASLSQVGRLLDLPLEVEAVVEGRALRVSELLELPVGSLVVSGRRRECRRVGGPHLSGLRRTGPRQRTSCGRMVNFKGKELTWK